MFAYSYDDKVLSDSSYDTVHLMHAYSTYISDTANLASKEVRISKFGSTFFYSIINDFGACLVHLTSHLITKNTLALALMYQDSSLFSWGLVASTCLTLFSVLF